MIDMKSCLCLCTSILCCCTSSQSVPIDAAVGDQHPFAELGMDIRADAGSALKVIPTSAAADFLGIWGSGPNDVFVVGTGSTIMHFDGASWQKMEIDSPADVEFRSVWGSGPEDVYTIGSGTVFHYDGKKWTTGTELEHQLNTVWGADSHNVYVSGLIQKGGSLEGVVVHYDGTTWNTETISDVGVGPLCGSSPSDIFAMSHSIHHFDGKGWTKIVDKGMSQYQGMWCGAKNSFIAVADMKGPTDDGFEQEIMHYDQGNLTYKKVMTEVRYNYSSIWGAGPSAVFAAGSNGGVGSILLYDGTQWTEITDYDKPGLAVTEDLWGIWGTSNSNIYAVGDRGLLIHADLSAISM